VIFEAQLELTLTLQSDENGNPSRDRETGFTILPRVEGSGLNFKRWGWRGVGRQGEEGANY